MAAGDIDLRPMGLRIGSRRMIPSTGLVCVVASQEHMTARLAEGEDEAFILIGESTVM